MLTGGILGLVPYAKLQAAPVAAALAIAGFALIWRRIHSSSLHWRRWQTLFFAIGGLLPSAMLLGALGAGGEMADVWVSNVTMPLFYVNTGRAPLPTVLTIFLLPDFAAFFFPAVLAALVFAALVAFTQRAVNTQHSWLLRALLLWCSASTYVVLQPGRPITHYTLFLVFPLTALVGSIFGILLATENSPYVSVLRPKLLGCLFIALTVFPSVVVRSHGRANPYLGNLRSFIAWPRGEVAQAMIDAASSGEHPQKWAAAVWGWAPELFMESGATLGTRDAVCQFQILPSSIRSYYRQRFLQDIQRIRPTIFVDAVGPSQFLYKDREQHGFETFPELAEWLAIHYEFFREVNHERIYRWRG